MRFLGVCAFVLASSALFHGGFIDFIFLNFVFVYIERCRHHFRIRKSKILMYNTKYINDRQK